MLKNSVLATIGSGEKNYIEDVFSTYLYTGSGSGTSQTITNNIDLSTKGGLVWGKVRTNIDSHYLFDTVRGVNQGLSTNSTAAQGSSGVSAFSTTGFTVGTNLNNTSARTFASWTFRKQPKFFDVQTFTTDSSSNATFSHSLGSSPGCVIFKKTGGAENWFVWHRSLTSTNYYLGLNTTAAQASTASPWISVSSSSISVMGAHLSASSAYVAYVFAHDAGGFGLTGADNVISCGTYAGNASGVEVNLGYEAQWVMVKKINSTGNWGIYDVMRGMPVWMSSGNQSMVLRPNTSDSETSQIIFYPTATGFKIPDVSSDVNAAGQTYIYIAIRRGPMKVPTDGTKVYGAASVSVSSSMNAASSFTTDLVLYQQRAHDTSSTNYAYSRLTGGGQLATNFTDASVARTNNFAVQTGYVDTNLWSSVGITSGGPFIYWMFKRAPSFCDVVCYTGTGSATTFNHNLGVAPELMIIKRRSAGAVSWAVYAAALGNTSGLELNTNGAVITGATSYWNSTTPTSSVFTVGTDSSVNTSGSTYVAYLFASCPGVSKIGTYTGTGAAGNVVNCGFASSARFVMIKPTSTTGDWIVFDSVRGIVAGNDPALKLNAADPESSSFDVIDTDSSGFVVNTSYSWINGSGQTYLYLAIA